MSADEPEAPAVRRLAPLAPDASMTDAQAAVATAIAESRGGVRGPFTFLLHRPEVAARTAELGQVLRFEGHLPAEVREATILAVARSTGCAFEWRTHRPIAAAAGVDDATVEAIRTGRIEAVSGDVGSAVRLAAALVRDKAVSDERYEEVAGRWDGAELVELVALVGYYTMLAFTLAAFDPLSDPETWPASA